MSECDEWEGWICSSTGYGQIKIDGVKVGVHRLVMMQEVGHLDSWQFVCHTCDNRKCINIEHLFVGTHADNARDMVAKGRNHQQLKTHCPQGHKYTKENTALRVRSNGPCAGNMIRVCRACERDQARNRYHRKKEAV